MLDYVKGEIAEIAPAYVVIDCGGVGYFANISLNTYTRLQNSREAKVFVYESVREDAYVLFGFADKQEREMFELLVSVSGVGPNTGRMILSSYTATDLQAIISSGSVAQLKSVKGIGAKTAERIIVDLKDKIKAGGNSLLNQTDSKSETYEESVAALVMLGFPQAAAQKVIGKLLKEQPTMKVEEAIKKALKML